MRRRRALRVMAVLVPALLAGAGCSDFGDPANLAPPPGDSPAITDLVPLRTFPGDTVLVQGSGFGETPGDVLFESSSLRAAAASATIVTWEPDRIRALVPANVAPGDVRVRVDGEESNGIAFGVAPEVSYIDDVLPLFWTFPQPAYHCVTCHAFGLAEGGLTVYPYSALILSPTVVPRRSSSSRLRQRLLPSTSVPQRMPQDGPPYMTDADILVIADWIDQGARDN